MLRGVDISNLQGPPEAYRAEAWYKAAEFVIVQTIRPPSPYRGWEVGGYTEAQLRAARQDGKKIGVYAFLWNTLPNVKEDITARLNIVPADLTLDFRPWVDVEDEAPMFAFQRQSAINAAKAAADAWASLRGLLPSGGYSRDEYIKDFLAGYWPEGWVYWQARLNGVNPPETELLPMRPLIQWTSTPVDTDIMLESELVVPTGPEDTVLIPDEYVTKFSLTDNHDVQGLIDNFEGVERTARAEEQAVCADKTAVLNIIRASVNEINVALTPAA